MNPVLVIAKKDLRCLVRDKQGLFWALAFPLVMALFFGAMYGGSGEGRGAMKLAVVDDDQTAASQACGERLTRQASLRVAAADADAARARVRKGDATAALRIEKGFGETSLFSGTPPRLLLLVDPARVAEAGMLEGLVTQAFFEGMRDVMAEPAKARDEVRRAAQQVAGSSDLTGTQRALFGAFFGALDRFLVDLPEQGLTGAGNTPFGGPTITREDLSRDDDRPRSAWEVTFPQAILWGLLGLIITFAVSMVRERQEGTLLRLRVAPVSLGQVLAGKGLAYAIATQGIVAILITLAVALFGLRIGSFPLLIVAMLATAAGFTGLMLLFTTLGKTIPAVSGVCSAFMVFAAMLGGGMIPLFFMPAWMQSVSHVSPVKWSILALEGALWRGFDLGEMALPCGVLIAIGLVAGFGGARLMRRAV